MARKRGGGGSARSGGLFGKKAAPAKSAPVRQAPARAPAPAPAPARAPAPAPAAAAPAPAPAAAAPAQSGGGMLSGLGGMVAQGMAMGTGSALAHQAVNSLMGGGSSSHASPAPAESAPAAPAPQAVSSDVCSMNQTDLYKCLQEQGGNASACQYYFDALKQCQDNQASSSWN